MYIVMSEAYWCVYSISLENCYVRKIQVQQMFQKITDEKSIYIFISIYTQIYAHTTSKFDGVCTFEGKDTFTCSEKYNSTFK